MKKFIIRYLSILFFSYLLAVVVTIVKFDGKIIVAICTVILGQLMFLWLCYGLLGLIMNYFFGLKSRFYFIFHTVNSCSYIYFFQTGNDSTKAIAYLFLMPLSIVIIWMSSGYLRKMLKF